LAVLVRRLIALLAVLPLLLAGCGGDDNDSGGGTAARPIAGDWIGTLKQKGLAPFRIAVQIEPSGSGRVAYTGIECGGTWTMQPEILGSDPPQYGFDEQIEEGVGGNCKGSGDVSIQPDAIAPSEVLDYAFTGGGVTSRGFLHKTDAAGLKPVFDEAGVTPP
jgi:hypothetical protein